MKANGTILTRKSHGHAIKRTEYYLFENLK